MQQSSKLRKSFSDTIPVIGKKLEKNNELSVEEKEDMLNVSDTVIKGDDFEGPSLATKKMVKRKKSTTKFSEYLEMEMGRDNNISGEKDLILERKLAKKLKVKNGKLGGPDDDMSLLLEGIPSVLDSMVEEDVVANSLENCEQGVSDEEVESEMESISVDEDSDSHASSEEHDKGEELIAPKNSRREKKRTRKTNFEEYLDMEEMQRGALAADEDIELEKKLAKKLKVKQGKLRGDDDVNSLFMGIPSVLDALKDPGTQAAETDPAKKLGSEFVSRKSSATNPTEQEQALGIFSRTLGTSEQLKNDVSDVGTERVPKMIRALGSNTKYVAPHLRSPVQNESEEYAKIRKRVRGI